MNRVRRIAYNTVAEETKDYKCIECGRAFTVREGEIIRRRSTDIAEIVCCTCTGRDIGR